MFTSMRLFKQEIFNPNLITQYNFCKRLQEMKWFFMV